MKIPKTNAARLLERAKIPFEMRTYPVDEQDLSAVHVAEVLGEDPARIFKTLVLKGDRTGYFVCLLPAQGELDLKCAAKVSGNKKADLIPMKELLPTTGYIRGACSPIGMKKTFPTFIDDSCTGLSEIYISAGIRGVQIKIDPQALVEFTRSEIVPLTESAADETR